MNIITLLIAASVLLILIMGAVSFLMGGGFDPVRLSMSISGLVASGALFRLACRNPARKKRK
jgi:hypothetical protein